MPLAHLLSDHLGDHVPGMDVDGADGHDLLPVAAGKLANQHGDQGVELRHLFPGILLHGVFVAFLQAAKRHADVSRPPDLIAGQRHLEDEIVACSSAHSV